jgi:hypothetical protein
LAARLFGDAAGSGHGPGIVGVCAGQLSLWPARSLMSSRSQRNLDQCVVGYLWKSIDPKSPNSFPRSF